MVLNEDNYPMTYKEYEKRVIELFLQDYEGDVLELMKQRVDDILSEEKNKITHSCTSNAFYNSVIKS